MDRPPLQRQGSRVRFAEGQEFVPTPPPPPSSTTATATSATNHQHGGPSPPGVYWDPDEDGASTATAGKNTTSSSANYTFYREGTPPPESSDHEKLVLKNRDLERERDVGGPGYPSVLSPIPIRPASAFPPYEVSKFDPNDPGPESDGDGGEGSLGRENREREQQEEAAKRKRYRWIFIAVALLFILIPIGVGTGVALGLKKNSSSGGGSAASATSPSSNGSPETSSPERPIPTLTTSTSGPDVGTTEPPRVVSGLINCPEANNTLYVVPGSTKTFLRNCGIDYNGTDGAYDLSHIYTTSMEQCMDVCASSDLCTGCGWGMIEGDKKGNYRCWMKNNLRRHHKARDDYCFAVLQY